MNPCVLHPCEHILRMWLHLQSVFLCFRQLCVLIRSSNPLDRFSHHKKPLAEDTVLGALSKTIFNDAQNWELSNVLTNTFNNTMKLL